MEFALIAPLLFAILLGTITGGLALSQKNSVANAVREGGRLGATLYTEDESWTWDDWAEDVKERVVTLAGSDLDDDEVCVEMVNASDDTVIGSFPAGGCPPSMPPGPETPDTAQGCLVKVWARTSAGLETIFFSRSVTLDGSAVGLYERSTCP